VAFSIMLIEHKTWSRGLNVYVSGSEGPEFKSRTRSIIMKYCLTYVQQ